MDRAGVFEMSQTIAQNLYPFICPTPDMQISEFLRKVAFALATEAYYYNHSWKDGGFTQERAIVRALRLYCITVGRVYRDYHNLTNVFWGKEFFKLCNLFVDQEQDDVNAPDTPSAQAPPDVLQFVIRKETVAAALEEMLSGLSDLGRETIPKIVKACAAVEMGIRWPGNRIATLQETFVIFYGHVYEKKEEFGKEEQCRRFLQQLQHYRTFGIVVDAMRIRIGEILHQLQKVDRGCTYEEWCKKYDFL